MTVDDVLAQVEYTKRRYGGGVPLTYAFADDVLFPDRDAQLRRRSNTTAELLAALDYICVNSYGRGQDGDPASSYFNLTRSGRGAEYPVATQVGQIVSHFERFRAFLAESAIERPVVLSETGRQSGHYAGLSLADAHLFNRNIDGWVQIQQQSKSPAVDGLFYFVLSDAAYKQSQGASPRACPACPACPASSSNVRGTDGFGQPRFSDLWGLYEMGDDHGLGRYKFEGLGTIQVEPTISHEPDALGLPDAIRRDLCDFGKALPFERVYAITMPGREAAVRMKLGRLCLGDRVRLLSPVRKSASLAELRPVERAEFSEASLAKLTLGEIAIHLSHRKAVMQCLADRAASCLVFEDDFVAGGHSLVDRWRASFAALPRDWQLLFLGKCVDTHCGESHVGGGLYRSDLGHPPACFHAFAVSHEGAAALLQAMDRCRHFDQPEVPCPVDRSPALLAAPGRESIFSISPALFTQSAFHRLAEVSTSQAGKTDLERRNFAVSQGAKNRPVIVAECTSGFREWPKTAYSLQRVTNLSDIPFSDAASSLTQPRAKLVSQGALFEGRVSALLRAAWEGFKRKEGAACSRLAEDGRSLGVFALFGDEGWQPLLSDPSLFVGLQACALEEARRSGGASQPRGVPTPFRCPTHPDDVFARSSISSPPLAGQLNEELAVMRLSGMVPFDTEGSVHRGQTIQLPSDLPVEARVPQQPVHSTFFETRAWPRPIACKESLEPRLDIHKRQWRPTLFKLVNRELRLEFRPILKAGSTFFSQVIPCLPGGKWEQVRQTTPTPAGFTTVVVIRHPIDRWASALVEIMQRGLLGQCPHGRCDRENDFYDRDTAARIANDTRWFRYAQSLFSRDWMPNLECDGHTAESRAQWLVSNRGLNYEAAKRQVIVEFPSVFANAAEPSAARARDNNTTLEGSGDAALEHLVRAAVLDTSCNLRYYGAEHLATQTHLMVQGQWEGKAPAVRTFQLEELSEDLSTLLQTAFVRLLVGGRGVPSRPDVEACILERAARDPERRRAPLSLNELLHGSDAHANKNVPRTSAIAKVARRDPAAMEMLCRIYAQDFACLQYACS
tara:strand:+ start:440 stop:3652 length:3213 start_codon:yes stop_codon:yes gene_type:complete